MTKYKIGDYVRIVKNDYDKSFNKYIDDICCIRYIDNNKYLYLITKDETNLLSHYHEVEPYDFAREIMLEIEKEL